MLRTRHKINPNFKIKWLKAAVFATVFAIALASIYVLEPSSCGAAGDGSTSSDAGMVYRLKPLATFGANFGGFGATARIADCCYCNEGKEIVLADATENKILVVDRRSLKIERTITGIDRPILLRSEPTSRILAVTCINRVYLIRTTDWTVAKEIGFGGSYLTVCATSSGPIAFIQRKPAYKQFNCMLRIMANGHHVETDISRSWAFDGGVAISPNGKWLVVGDSQYVTVIDTSNWRKIKVLSLQHLKPGEPVTGISFSENNQYVAFTSLVDSTINVFATGRWRYITSLSGLIGQPSTIQFGPRQVIYTFSDPDGVVQWSTTNGQQLRRYVPPFIDVSDGQVSPDGCQVVIIDWTNHALVYALPNDFHI